MKKIEITKSDARIVTNAGFVFVGNILDQIGFHDYCSKFPTALAHPEVQIPLSDIFATEIGILCSGNSTFESSREFKADLSFYSDVLGMSRLASAERFRQRLDQASTEEITKGFDLHDGIREINKAILELDLVNLTPICNGDLPVDCDVTPYDESKSHKEGVTRTYKGHDGYAPMNAYIGKEGFCVNTDFRIGKQHSQRGTPEFLIETIDMCNEILREKNRPRTLLFRLDSGNDSSDNIGIIIDRGHHFIIKRNLRKESREEYLENAKRNAPIRHNPRDGKNVYIGSTWKPITYTGMDGKPKVHTIRIVYEVIERTIDKYGQFLLFPDIEVNSWWDNTGLPDEKVIELYHEHGTMEQFHSEFKSDMDIERLPSGKFATNRLVHELSLIAYNILRIMGDHLCDAPEAPVRTKAFRRRLRTVILHIIHTPARVISHSRKISLDLGSSNAWADTFIWLSGKLCAAS